MCACVANADAEDVYADDAVLVGGADRRTTVEEVVGSVIGGVIS